MEYWNYEFKNKMAAIKYRKYEKALRVRDSTVQEYLFELLNERKCEYRRTRATSLKIFDALYNKYTRNIRIIKNHER